MTATTSRGTRRGRLAPPTGRVTPLFVGLLVCIATLTSIGLVMVLSASSVAALDEHGSSWHYFNRQLLWVGAGAGVLLLTLRVDYHRWSRMAGPLLLVAGALMVLVLVPGLGVTVNGSTRWLGYGPFQIQPSEFAKLAVVLWLSDLLSRRVRHVGDSRAVLHPALLVVALFSALLLFQPNLGTTMVLAAIAGALLFVGGVPLGRLLGWGAAGAAFAGWLSLSASYRRDRVLAFLDPWDDPMNTGWQTIQSLVGVTSGGITGSGLGESRAKWGFLPFAHTDFIFSIIGEELGLLGTLTVVLLFMAIGVLGIRTALCAPDRFGTLLAAGVTAWILVQAFVNIGAVVGILPITGVPLPFVSFGGSSLLSVMFATGVLLNVARQARPPAPT